MVPGSPAATLSSCVHGARGRRELLAKGFRSRTGPDARRIDTDNYWIRNVVGVSFYRYLVIVEKGSNPTDNAHPCGTTAASPLPAVSRELLGSLRGRATDDADIHQEEGSAPGTNTHAPP